MRKISLLILILMIILFQNLCAKSQKGIKVGGNFSQILVNNSTGELGVSFGVAKEWFIANRFAIGGELLFSTRRSQLKNKRILFYPGVIATYDIHCSFGYIELPILMKFYYPISKTLKIQLQAGPSFSFGIFNNSDAKYKPEGYSVNFGEYTNQDSLEYDYGEIFDPGPLWPATVFSSFLGLNVGFGLNWLDYTLEFRYYYSKLHDVYTGSFLLDLDENYHTFHFLLGIRF
jgi:hypothetical protein